jgi:MFS transporter, ACS family, hexuronate transporter
MMNHWVPPPVAPFQSQSIRARISRAFAVGRVRWGMLALVFFATTLNYIDRAALGVLQPVLSQALHWTPQDYANINFWFQVGYALGYVVQGRMIDSFGVRRTFAVAVALWSIAAAAHGVAASVAGFMVCRFLLGLAEAANYPSCVKTTRLWFPAGERAMAAGIFNAGTNVGAMMTPLLVPFLLTVWGWQAVFYVVGAAGALWLVFWLRHYHDPEVHPGAGKEELAYIADKGDEAPAAKLPYAQVLRLRATWTYALGNMLSAPVFWFYLYWLPPYLNKQFNLGISVSKMGMSLIVIYLMADLGSVAGGALSSWMIGRGVAPVVARLRSMALCALCIVPVVLASSADGLWEAVACIAIAVGAHQAWTANMWSLAMDMSPKSAVSSVFGFGGMVGAIGGMFMTQVVGYVLTASNENYSLLFTLIPCCYLVGLLWMWFMAPRKPETVR